jgi:hypothetical protein
MEGTMPKDSPPAAKNAGFLGFSTHLERVDILTPAGCRPIRPRFLKWT